MSTPGLDALTDVLTAFCNREGLQPLSADEMLAAGGLNAEQRQWPISFRGTDMAKPKLSDAAALVAAARSTDTLRADAHALHSALADIVAHFDTAEHHVDRVAAARLVSQACLDDCDRISNAVADARAAAAVLLDVAVRPNVSVSHELQARLEIDARRVADAGC